MFTIGPSLYEYINEKRFAIHLVCNSLKLLKGHSRITVMVNLEQFFNWAKAKGYIGEEYTGVVVFRRTDNAEDPIIGEIEHLDNAECDYEDDFILTVRIYHYTLS